VRNRNRFGLRFGIVRSGSDVFGDLSKARCHRLITGEVNGAFGVAPGCRTETERPPDSRQTAEAWKAGHRSVQIRSH
jgi:hypothetical protein